MSSECGIKLIFPSEIFFVFFLVFLGYLWYSVVSLFQIIIVVNSTEYKANFGNDPLVKKTKRNTSNTATSGWTQNVVENVKFYPSPDFNSSYNKPLKPHEKISPTTISMGGQAAHTHFENGQHLLHKYYAQSNRSYY